MWIYSNNFSNLYIYWYSTFLNRLTSTSQIIENITTLVLSLDQGTVSRVLLYSLRLHYIHWKYMIKIAWKGD